jgi:hypothetical protein
MTFVNWDIIFSDTKFIGSNGVLVIVSVVIILPSPSSDVTLRVEVVSIDGAYAIETLLDKNGHIDIF